MKLNQKVIFLDTVFSQEVDTETVLLDMNSESYFGLDEVASDIWKLLKEEKTLQETLQILLGMYEIDPETLEKDLIEFVGKLKESGLIEFS